MSTVCKNKGFVKIQHLVSQWKRIARVMSYYVVVYKVTGNKVKPRILHVWRINNARLQKKKTYFLTDT